MAPHATSSRRQSSPSDTAYIDRGRRSEPPTNPKLRRHKQVSTAVDPPLFLSFGFAPICRRYATISLLPETAAPRSNSVRLSRDASGLSFFNAATLFE